MHPRLVALAFDAGSVDNSMRRYVALGQNPDRRNVASMKSPAPNCDGKLSVSAEKEITMRTGFCFLSIVVASTSFANAWAGAEKSPKLPETYAEVVLHVKGMT